MIFFNLLRDLIRNETLSYQFSLNFVLGNPNFFITIKEKECCKLHSLTSSVTRYLEQITNTLISNFSYHKTLSFRPVSFVHVTGFRYRPFLSIIMHLFASIPSPTLEKLTPHTTDAHHSIPPPTGEECTVT